MIGKYDKDTLTVNMKDGTKRISYGQDALDDAAKLVAAGIWVEGMENVKAKPEQKIQ